MKPLLLMILDGWGYSENPKANATKIAKLPNWDKTWKSWPHTTIKASGLAVGLPDKTMGNSEVGHLNIGAGRVVYQEYTRINKAIEDGSFFKNKVLKDIFEKLKKNGAKLHLMGLCSDIGVHSHLDHLYAIIDFAAKEGLKNIFVHCFTDGRDSAPDSGLSYVKQVEEKIKGRAKIATVEGRYYAMDRDKRWDRVEKAYRAMVDGVGNHAVSAVSAVEESYKSSVTDEFIVPTVIMNGSKPVAKIENDDAVVFYNFRSDRAREMTRALTDEKFSEFKREPLRLSGYACMTQYDETFSLPMIFPPEKLANIFGEVISKNGLHQLRIAETEKYAHVTFFFNGGEENVFPNEDRALIQSPRDVPTYDKKPEMSAFAVTEELLKRIDSGKYDVIILNFANPDMVGHSGNMDATVKAIEAVDTCMGKVLDKVVSVGGAALITADHGNCEEMEDSRGHPQTAHSINPVPFIFVVPGMEKKALRTDGSLADIAPTMLELLNIKKSEEMTGRSLIK